MVGEIDERQRRPTRWYRLRATEPWLRSGRLHQVLDIRVSQRLTRSILGRRYGHQFWIVVGTLTYWAILIITRPLAFIGQAVTRGTAVGSFVFGLVGLALSLVLVCLLSVSVIAHYRTGF